ncbi:ribosomal-protein-alanine N-acetyltransferase [Erysipelotrichaceae bacterium Oil+RF-744-GAM-WT-6]|uniref:[Ribosomal protein bS18]-alanine N-acetyltransferase n=1 Tax=Stecheria intestinalis TaxID=2606630 RepID=A0A7X2NUJ0_9FIRM|nr:ribosomal protein S18-alanine N-acetyltransferase [Stecheria intestinalis]MCI6745712.1 ribosomal protein S18-alanine N-acetyltransferase [Anaerolactibacter massiliensis]MDD7679213.1 ribosomal protein S18-alanine N-acetyltransferase [Stecheria intestinalis]MDY4682318.1 ribosomal protein S18-alanine N-acetyltransferase [Lachnospiraceae bacterium]MSS59800.1 ribosomal-protein-alanine N-acetyltransferase [Stecheria intestinalis]
MIRAAEDQDLDRIAELENVLFADSPWPWKEFEHELHENPFAILLVDEEEGRVVGYLDYWILYEQAQVATIGVDPEYQNRGIGSALLSYAEKDAADQGCETFSLEVRVSNAPARHLYEKHGFIQVNIRKGYYENGEDAYLMVKPIGGQKDDADIRN